MTDDINTVHLRGTLAFDADFRYVGQNNTPLLTFKIEMASARRKNRVSVKVWGAEPTIHERLRKGARVELTGRIEDGSYNSKKHDGEKVYTTDVVVERDALVILEVGGAPLGRQPHGETQTRRQPEPPPDDFGPAGDLEDLPF